MFSDNLSFSIDNIENDLSNKENLMVLLSIFVKHSIQFIEMVCGLSCLQLGASSKFANIFTIIYADFKAYVRSDNTLSDWFECFSGVKQGEPSSSLLFILFINDFYENLITTDNDDFTMNNIKLVLYFCRRRSTVCIRLLDSLHSYFNK